MSFIIGGITLPRDPEKIKSTVARDISEVKLYIASPMLLPFGPLTPVLVLTGKIAEAAHTKADLETDYILPLRALVWGEMAFSRILIDDGGNAYWTATAGTPSDDAVDFAKGVNAYKLILAGQTLAIHHDYATDQNYSSQDFISYWFKGCNSGKTISIYFYNEVYAGKTNGYKYDITDNLTTWRRLVIRKNQFSNVATPTGWNHIRCIAISSSDTITGTLRFDRTVVGVGVYVDGPDTRYDGVWLLKEFITEEAGGQIRHFPYTLTLWNEDSYF